ncbi:MAG: HlyD family secretion protein [Candidatus Saccharicenans sp.]
MDDRIKSEVENEKDNSLGANSLENSEGSFQEEIEDVDQVPIFKKKRVIIPFLLLIIAVIAGTWYWYKNLRLYVSTDDAYVDADRISISSKVLGRITQLKVDEGSQVKAGELLVVLDDTELKAQLDQAKANLALALDSLPLYRVNVEKATDDFNRAEFQFKHNTITKEQFDHASKALDAAKAEYAIALSRIKVAKAQVALIEAQLLNLTIYSPLDGVVAKRWVLPGEVVKPGQPIFSIYRQDNLWVTANLEETKVSRIQIGSPVEIQVDAYPRHPFHGRVFLIGDYTAAQFSLIPPNNASGNFTKVTQRVPIKISLDDLTPENKQKFPLSPGLSVEIRIRANSPQAENKGGR